jgi:membrane protease YdiL (CAAX protease family)
MTMQQRGGQNPRGGQNQNKAQAPLSPLAQPNVNAISSYVVGEFILGGIAVLAARWVGINPAYWADAIKNPQGAQLLTAAIAAIPLVLAQPLTDRLPWFQGITRDTKLYTLALLGYKKDIPKALGIGLLLSVAAAVGEELFFRGVLQTGFSGAYGPTWGLLISSFLFGVFHTPFPAANAFVESLFGVAVGVLYASSGYNIAVPIVTHAAYDVLTILRQHVEITDTVQNVSGRLKAATQNQPADSPQVAKKIDELKRSKNLPEDFIRLGRTIFAFLDLDNSGSINKGELQKGLSTLNGKKPSDKEAEDLIKAVDSNKDGQIDFAEFLQSAVNAVPQVPNPQRK